MNLRYKSLHVVALLLTCIIQSAQADVPEPGPSYARTVAEREDASLHAIAFYDAKLGIATGDHGTILRTDDGGLTWQVQPSPVECRLNEVVWVNERRVVAVGGVYDRITNLSRGVTIVSDNAGLDWRRAEDQELPRLNSVTRRDDRVIIASGDWSDASLTNRFESHDGGIRWQPIDPSGTQDVTLAELTAANQLAWASATGHHLPIRAVDQVGDKSVWAVGDHGVILHSEDGGQTWQARRGHGRQSSILMIASSPRTVAWSILGKESLELRHRVSVLVMPHNDDLHASRSLEIAGQVAMTFGAAGMDSVSSQSALEQPVSVLENAAAWIAVHHPTVILLDRAISDDLRAEIIETSASLGVTRILEYHFSASGTERGDTMLHQAAMLAETGILAGDLSSDALHWIAPHDEPPVATILRRRYDSSGSHRTGESVTAGLSLPPTQRKTVDHAQASRRQLQIVQARMSESKRLHQLLTNQPSINAFLPAFQSLLDQTAQEDRFRLLWMMLRKTSGRHESSSYVSSLHQVVLDELILRYPNTSVGNWAVLRRDAITYSSEWNRLRESLRHVNLDSTRVVSAAADVVPVSPFQIESTFTDDSTVTQASATIPLLITERAEINPASSHAPSVDYEIDLSWEFHPTVLLAREAARQRGDNAQLQSTTGSANLSRLAAYRSPWSHLLDANEPSVVQANRTTTPPRLDGLTNDPCWAMATAKAEPPLQLAYDDQYVYVLIRQPADQLGRDTLQGQNAKTVRDQDLIQVDRMQLRIDIDADLLTSMQFEFTDAGRTSDAIDGFHAWQPSWYVASSRSDDYVNIELAILRHDLSELPIHAGQHWFVSARPIAAGTETARPIMPAANDWVRVVFR